MNSKVLPTFTLVYTMQPVSHINLQQSLAPKPKTILYRGFSYQDYQINHATAKQQQILIKGKETSVHAHWVDKLSQNLKDFSVFAVKLKNSEETK